MSKRLRVFVILTLIVGILSGTVSAFDGGTVKVYFQEDGNPAKKTVASHASTVEEFLSEQQITLGEYDTTIPALDVSIEPDMEISIISGVTVNVVIDKELADKQPIQSKLVTLGEFVSTYSEQSGTSYVYEPSLWDTAIYDGMDIHLSTQSSSTFTTVTEIPFETQIVEAPEIGQGIEVKIIAGLNGETTTITRVDYVSGEEISREVILEEITVEPVNEVILKGTAAIDSTYEELAAVQAERLEKEITAKRQAIEDAEAKKRAEREAQRIAEEKRLEELRLEELRQEELRQEKLRLEQEAIKKENDRIAAEKAAAAKAAAAKAAAAKEAAKKTIAGHEYTKEITMTATAYTSDYASTGKRPGDKGFGITYTGMKAQVGVVAVDPKVIPLGTKLYIEGYGKAVAGDIGSSIKGNRIDLYFNSNRECLVFGVKQIKVYVLN